MKEMKEMTIEQMIENGASWSEIKAAVSAKQQEVNRQKQIAAAQAKEAKAKQEASGVARERFITAFLDWMIAEQVLGEEDREAFKGMLENTVDQLLMEMKQLVVLEKVLGLKL